MVAPSDVAAVIDTNLEPDEIQPFIDDAELEVDERLDNTGLSNGRKELISKYLAAHLIRHMRERQKTQTSIGSGQKTYSGAFGEGLKGTSPGQRVLELDTSGTFAATPKPAASELHVIDGRGFDG